MRSIGSGHRGRRAQIKDLGSSHFTKSQLGFHQDGVDRKRSASLPHHGGTCSRWPRFESNVTEGCSVVEREPVQDWVGRAALDNPNDMPLSRWTHQQLEDDHGINQAHPTLTTGRDTDKGQHQWPQWNRDGRSIRRQNKAHACGRRIRESPRSGTALQP